MAAAHDGINQPEILNGLRKVLGISRVVMVIAQGKRLSKVKCFSIASAPSRYAVVRMVIVGSGNVWCTVSHMQLRENAFERGDHAQVCVFIFAGIG